MASRKRERRRSVAPPSGEDGGTTGGADEWWSMMLTHRSAPELAGLVKTSYLFLVLFIELV